MSPTNDVLSGNTLFVIDHIVANAFADVTYTTGRTSGLSLGILSLHAVSSSQPALTAESLLYSIGMTEHSHEMQQYI